MERRSDSLSSWRSQKYVINSSFWFAYLCDYEVGSLLNTDQPSPRGQDVTSPGPVDTEHRQTRCQQNTWQTLSLRDQAAETHWVSIFYTTFILYNGCFTARVNRKCFCANELTLPEEYSWKFPLNRDVLVSGEIFIKHARTRVFWPQPVGAGAERAVKSKLRRSETHRGTGGDPLGAVTASVSQEYFGHKWYDMLGKCIYFIST